MVAAPLAPALSGETAKFVSISNVLGGIQRFDRASFLGRDMHAKAVRHIVGGTKQPKRRSLPKTASRLLRIAWQTELAATVKDQFNDPLLLRVSAQTLPVEAYYAVFNCARATTETAGTPCATHQAVHRDFATQRVSVGYRAWGVTLDGDPEDVTACVLSPSITQPSGFNLMEMSHDPQDYVFGALRMARRWKYEEKRSDWLRTARRPNKTKYKALPRGQRAKLLADLRPTTVVDFLYGLRVRTNYESIEEYTSDADDFNIAQFHSGLLHVTDMGLLHYETLLALGIGKTAYEKEAQAWCDTNTNSGRGRRKRWNADYRRS